ncbi:PIG-L deacetylase family protein [Arthrobacter roseus]|uniref:PIG-L deacetylase family protein n=1 Tax=Arthrobacter roseus TaxID=136274 RepID=UPI003084256D|nr:LmbE family N-acetylglucosaminyl deacetylase [Arthrobacter roseus]
MSVKPTSKVDGVHPRRVLCFSAHPDDIDFGAAGTVAGWTEAGAVVTYCIMTGGDAGGFDAAHRPDIVSMRNAEQKAAASLVGVLDIRWLGYQDGYLQADHALIRDVVRVMREVRPDVVVAMHPERSWDRLQKSHPDHLACGEAVTRAVYPAVENPFAYPELAEAGLEAFKVSWLWFYGAPLERENHFVDMSPHLDAKLAAIHIHSSQHPDLKAMESTVRSILRENAERAGLGEGRSAEAFHVVGVNTPATFAGF